MEKRNTYLVLLFLFLAFTAKAQVVDHVIFTEALGNGPMANANYGEITNVGDTAVNLNRFVVGKVWRGIHTGVWPNSYVKGSMVTGWVWLPDQMLQPGESYVIGQVNDYTDTYYPDDPFSTPTEILNHIDLPIFLQEATPLPAGRIDSISSLELRNLRMDRMGLYLEYHIGGDSILVDAVFNANNLADDNNRTVAGIPMAYGRDMYLVRKSNVKKGNINWDDSRGTNTENSEWLVLPKHTRFTSLNLGPQNNSIYRRWYTTIGHHGNATLDATTVSSSVISIDWNNRVMTVPWGILREHIMDEFELGPGLAWNVRYTPSLEDSIRNIILTGDTLKMFAVGETLQQIDFRLEQAPPASDMNQVFPMNMMVNVEGEINSWPTPYYVTNGMPEIDTIGDIGFRTRVDTLFKYLEKAPIASWEIEWVDGVARADVKRGDLLKVTAQNGSVKNYYLSVDSVPAPSSNAFLSAITWPDVPGYLRESPQWNEDTIPGFIEGRFSYTLKVPFGTTNVPALKAIPVNINAKIKEERATLVNGPVEARTTKFTVTSEDDSVTNVYSIIIVEDKPSALVQSHNPNPFINLIAYRVWGTNMFIEIHNPGNQPLDLSDYMIIRGIPGQDPVQTVGRISTVFNNRYDAYIFGYDYQSEVEWNVKPAIVEKDFAVNPVIGPGESFILGRLQRQIEMMWNSCDVIFVGPAIEVPVEVNKRVIRMINNSGSSPCNQNANGTSVMLFKILNDSILSGEKGIGDIEDVELIDVFGDYAGTHWSPEGVSINVAPSKYNIWRKPQFWKGNPLPGFAGSWGNTPEESEWFVRSTDYFNNLGFAGFDADLQMYLQVGTHTTDLITEFSSTVDSYFYKVSKGYTTPQSIEGVPAGTKVSDFMLNIIKANDDQLLEIMGKTGEETLVENDTLVVTSADGENITKYAIFIGALSSDAVLTSSVYTITIDGNAAVIAGIPGGTSIKQVLTNVNKPQTAILNVINDENRLVPMQVRNYDTVYVNTAATNKIYFEVVAENGVAKITYQLQLDLTDSDAFVFSDMFTVNQELQFISGIPSGIRVREFMYNLTANEGAEVKLYDKLGSAVELGNVAWDDIIIVTSPDGETTKIYALNFLNEPSGTDAYVVSSVLAVDQLERIISEIEPGLGVNVFLGLLKPAQGATITLLDSNGNVKTSGTVEEGDQVQVVSGNEEITVVYALEFLVGIDQLKFTDFRVYPNPAKDVLYFEGISESSEIVIRNILGSTVKMIDSRNISHGEISVADIPAGIYFIYLQNKNDRSNPLKVVIQ